jgi:hypothetical protein
VADRDPEAIKADIDRARDQLAATVDTLSDRASPSRLAADARAGVVNFIKKPAVTFSLIGLGALAAVLVVRRIRNR